MICPHCKKDIPDSTVAKHLASKGGKASKRKITPEQQAAMQAARNMPKDIDVNDPFLKRYSKKGKKS